MRPHILILFILSLSVVIFSLKGGRIFKFWTSKEFPIWEKIFVTAFATPAFYITYLVIRDTFGIRF